MDTIRKFKIEQNLLKLYVLFSGFSLTAYCIALCFGVRHCVAEIILVTLAYIVLAGGAWIFRLCALSWLFIVYTYAVRICIILQPEGWFGEYLDVAHYIAAGCGTALCVMGIIKYNRVISEYHGDNE